MTAKIVRTAFIAAAVLAVVSVAACKKPEATDGAATASEMAPADAMTDSATADSAAAVEAGMAATPNATEASS